MAKKFGEQALLDRLERYVFVKYGGQEIQWFNDTEDNDNYYWNFEVAGERIKLACNKTTGGVGEV